VPLEAVREGEELAVGGGEAVLHLGDRLRRADAGDDVLALRVLQELPVEPVLAGGGVPREADAGPARLAHVPVDHRLHVDGGAEQPGDPVDPAVATARSLLHEPKTASMAKRSCSRGSSGNM
jgi:hypothetical protein